MTLFAQDLYGGADPQYQIKIRVSPSSPGTRCSSANCLIRPRPRCRDFVPD